MTAQLLPWHVTTYQKLWQSYQADRLSHAVLLTAPMGSGKRRFAAQLGQALLCTKPTDEGQPCGDCHACRLVVAGNHPDLLWLNPPPEKRIINIDQVRQLVVAMTKTAQLSRYKVVIIDPAEAMNIAAANALLKTLEEPTPNTLLVLLSAQPAMLLPTIRSRCQVLSLPPASRDEAERWLQTGQVMASGAAQQQALALTEYRPLLAEQLLGDNGLAERQSITQNLINALENQSDPVQVASELQIDLGQTIEMMQVLVRDILYIKCSGDVQGLLDRADEQKIMALSQRLNVPQLLQYESKLLDYARSLKRNVQLNAGLVAEDICITATQQG